MSAVTGCLVSLTTDEPVDVTCRVLSALVGPSTMHVARVLVDGVEVYPTQQTAPPATAAALQCELRMRRAGAFVDEGALADVMGRLGRYEASAVRVLADTASPTAMRPLVDTAA